MKKLVFCVPSMENILPNLQNLKFQLRAQAKTFDSFHSVFDLLKYIFKLSASQDFPLAALLAKHYQLEGASHSFWGRLTPVLLQADWAGLYLVDYFAANRIKDNINEFENIMNLWHQTMIEHDHENAFVQENQVLTKTNSATLRYPDDLSCLLLNFSAQEVSTVPFEDVLHKEISIYLPQGDFRKTVKSWLTEWQMLFQATIKNSSTFGANAFWLDCVGGLPSSFDLSYDFCIYQGFYATLIQEIFPQGKTQAYNKDLVFTTITENVVLVLDDRLLNIISLENYNLESILLDYIEKIFKELGQSCEIEIWSLENIYHLTYTTSWFSKLFKYGVKRK